MLPEQIHLAFRYFVQSVIPFTLIIMVITTMIVALVQINHKRRYFKSFIGVEPPKKEDKKEIAFLQKRVNNVFFSLASNIQRAIDEEENFQKSDKKLMFDNHNLSSEESKKILREFNELGLKINRAKKIFWKLYKIVKPYGFELRNGFKDYLSIPNEW